VVQRGSRVGAIAGILAVWIAVLLSCSSFASTVGGVTITLHSHKYYPAWNMTRFVYRISRISWLAPSYWVLGIGDDIGDEQIDIAGSTSYVWVDDPLSGLAYTSISSNRKFYLWLYGQWDAEPVDMAVVYSGWGYFSDLVYTGTIDGPATGGSMLSVEVVSGSQVEFPQIIASGTYDAATTTQLEIESTLSGWALDWDLSLSIPESADASAVERVFELAVDPYVAAAGMTQVDVHYALTISDEDFSGLPEGGYQIGITYTVTTGD